MAATPKTEAHYVWRKFVTVGDETEPRLIVPHGDPMAYERPFDYLFDSVAAAYQGLNDFDGAEDAAAENWVLCRHTVEPVSWMDHRRLPPDPGDADGRTDGTAD